MAVKVHGSPIATSTAHVLICLHEKGVKYELVPVNIFAREYKEPHFLAKNPFGHVPAFDDGDLTLFEPRAITRYLATKHKDVGTDLLRLGNVKESALVNVWLEVESQQLHPAISQLVFQRLVIPYNGGISDMKVIEKNVEKLGKVLDVYEERLSKTKYLAGDFYSLADLHHLAYTFYLMDMPEALVINSRPHVKAWWEDISSRPAFKEVAKGMVLPKPSA